MIGALVTLISLSVTDTLVDAGVVANTLPITGATVTTPIHITSPNHQVPPGRVLHGVISGVVGTTEANGLWVMTPVDANTLALTSYSAQGIPYNSVGVNAYISGGQIEYAFPDFGILLGRRNQALTTAVASPRILFVPVKGRKFGFEPYGGAGTPAQVPNVRGTLEQQSERLQPQLWTAYSTFAVYVTGSAPDYNHGAALSPDFGDFDATQAIAFALLAVLFDQIGPARCQILYEDWPSQTMESGTQTQRGQQWMCVLEFQQPVTRSPLEYVPIGTYMEMTVEPASPGSSDPLTFVAPPQT